MDGRTEFFPFYRTLSPIGAAAQKPMLLHTAAYLLFVANARLAGLSPDLSCLQLDLLSSKMDKTELPWTC